MADGAADLQEKLGAASEALKLLFWCWLCNAVGVIVAVLVGVKASQGESILTNKSIKVSENFVGVKPVAASSRIAILLEGAVGLDVSAIVDDTECKDLLVRVALLFDSG